MSDTKMECPSCGSWTNAIGQAALAGEPCPYCGRPLPKVERGPMSTDDARGVERPAALTALRRFAEAQAVTARSLGQGQTERGWLDALALLDQADKQLARLIEQREAAARAEALREAAEAWAHSEWSNVLLPKPTPPAVPVIAYANRVGDWLRDRAVLAGQGGESGEGA